SLAGDIFQLGNKSYRIRRVERGVVRVEDAQGMAPTMPFWLGEAPGRSDELSESVSRLRTEIATRLEHGGAAGSAIPPLSGGGMEHPPCGRPICDDRAPPGEQNAITWLTQEVGLGEAAAQQLVDYLAAGHGALGTLPTHDTIVLERFFDAAGGMQLVIHSPYGSRINRAWGLALRKRFCRKFNFGLQAAATEDNIILSLTTTHSFELDSVAHYLHSASVRPVLVQALLD